MGKTFLFYMKDFGSKWKSVDERNVVVYLTLPCCRCIVAPFLLQIVLRGPPIGFGALGDAAEGCDCDFFSGLSVHHQRKKSAARRV